jgi:hypothetical protein
VPAQPPDFTQLVPVLVGEIVEPSAFIPEAPRRMTRRKMWAIGVLLMLVVLGIATVAWGLSEDPAQPVGLSETATSRQPGPDPAARLPGLGYPAPSLVPSVSRPGARPLSTGAAARLFTKPAVAGRPVRGAWPNAGNTGVPVGTKLTAYTGSCVIASANAVIDAKTINCDTLEIRAKNVTIKRSKVNGGVLLDTDITGSANWSYTLADSEVNAGLRQLPAVSYGNMTVLRSNIYGGAASVQCGEHALFCAVQDSYLHGQRIPVHGNWHLDGFLSNGGTNVRLLHNTIICDTPVNNVGEGCTGDLTLLGDFAPVSDVVADNNLLGASIGESYCIYGGSADGKAYPRGDHIVITNNVFQRGTNRKCGAYGPVTAFDSHGAGNVWRNNKWDDGGLVAGEM